MISLVVLGACNVATNVDIELEKSAVLSADSAFSAMSDARGMGTAFLAYADSSVVELSEGSAPIQGIAALEFRYRNLDDKQFLLTWQALKCEVAASGDLAYTFGDYTMQQKDTVTYGNYVTIWKKQKDGKWKFVLDGGNSTPGPTVVR